MHTGRLSAAPQRFIIGSNSFRSLTCFEVPLLLHCSRHPTPPSNRRPPLGINISFSPLRFVSSTFLLTQQVSIAIIIYGKTRVTAPQLVRFSAFTCNSIPSCTEDPMVRADMRGVATCSACLSLFRSNSYRKRGVRIASWDSTPPDTNRTDVRWLVGSQAGACHARDS